MIAAWLYPGEVREYTDGDLVVSPANWDRAVARLEAMGFHDFLRDLEHPRMASEAGTGFLRGTDSIDLHSTLPGLRADPVDVWQELSATAESMPVGGRMVRVPNRAGVLMHIALHAVHHVEGKPIEDLARAVRIASDDEWRAAAALAARLGGLEAFASGLRLLPKLRSSPSALTSPTRARSHTTYAAPRCRSRRDCMICSPRRLASRFGFSRGSFSRRPPSCAGDQRLRVVGAGV